MTAIANALTEQDLTLTSAAQAKMAELIGQVEDNIEGVRVFATPGGCSGVSFGMTFTDQLGGDDNIRDFDGFRVVVDNGTLEYVKGVEIDFVDAGNGDARFVFNNLQPIGGGGGGGGCGTCGSSQGGGCS